MTKKNLHSNTVKGFGDEWERFDQSYLSKSERQNLFDLYFSIFPWDALPENAKGIDIGCGSGRWAQLVAPLVGTLNCVDPSSALEIAKRNLAEFKNCNFYSASVEDMPFEDESMDFAYSLGVLHHVPNTQEAITSCVQKLKPNAPFLIYLYYAFDNRPAWFRSVWKMSDFFRKGISRMPHSLRYATSQGIAASIYYPLAKNALLLESLGMDVSHLPLSAYRNCSFYTMRTDALDRFGTQLEQRFTKEEVTDMMETAGLENIVFSNEIPFWCAVGYRKIAKNELKK